MLRNDLPTTYNAVEILERNLAERRDAPALVSPSRTLTFGQVSEGVNRVANALRRAGVRSGDHVAILCPDSPEWVLAFFGTIKAGAIATSLTTLATPDEIGLMLADCQARVLFAHESLLPLVDPNRERLRDLERVVVVGRHPGGFDAFIADELGSAEAAPTSRDDFCCLNFSSGTTGAAKGIHHSHADLPITAALVGRGVLGLRSSDRTFATARLFFTYGTGGNLIFPWSVGATIIVTPELPRDPRKALQVIEAYRPTVLFNVPTGYASLLAVPGFPGEFDISSLRLCVSAGEALPGPLWQRWKEHTGLDLIDGIGSTENYHVFISNSPGDIRPGSSGRPVKGYEIEIRDETGSPIREPRVMGDLYVRGETAALSYHRRYAERRRNFQCDWLRTGDKYYFDEEGYFWHGGRADDMLKVGGIWVSPTEVESVLLNHEAVDQCAVVGDRDNAGLVKPRAYVVLRGGSEPGPELARSLVEYCVERLASYKRPRWVDFVSTLPKTGTGKIQRFRLRASDAGRAGEI